MRQDERHTLLFDSLLSELREAFLVVDLILAERACLRREYLQVTAVSPLLPPFTRS